VFYLSGIMLSTPMFKGSISQGSFFGGILALFCFVRMPYLHPPTLERKIAPGEWYWIGQQPYKCTSTISIPDFLTS
jgi:hypothetical protein